MSKNIIILIPDGVGIRNYLYSDVLKHLVHAGYDIIIWHNLGKEVIREAEGLHHFKLKSYSFRISASSYIVRILRETTTYARLRLNARLTNNPTILNHWKKNIVGFKSKVLYTTAKTFGSLFGSFRFIEKTEAIIYFLERREGKAYKQFLEKLKPDVLFCTHQRVAEVSPIMQVANDMGIKTVTAIFSWDNLPKARLPYRTDKYLVWSDHMKKELLQFYPEISAEQIAITGTPQFDFYNNHKLIISWDEFALANGLDCKKHWVLFSGDDKSTSPYDHLYLADVAEALKDEKDMQIIFRQVPVEGIDRYLDVLNKYPMIRHLNPQWKKGSAWNYFYPTFSDVKMLVNLAFYCEVVINIGSTMALDFALFEKPCLFINYDLYNKDSWSVKTIYRYQHFKTMQGLNPVGWINSKTEIKNKIRQAINFPEQTGSDKQIWLNRIIQHDSKMTASQKVANALIN